MPVLCKVRRIPHDAGILSQPGRPRCRFQIGSWDQDTAYQSPDEWVASAESHEGSWWPAWQHWLANYSGKQIEPPAMGNADKGYEVLEDAPGTYVFE